MIERESERVRINSKRAKKKDQNRDKITDDTMAKDS